jgi:lipid-A-disaccharide synthase
MSEYFSQSSTSVLKNLGTITKNLNLCRQQITAFKPDVVILVDYPGFNLRMARFAKENGFRVFYYISPKLWAWNEKRVEKIRKYVDRMYIIFPFETAFYNRYGIEAVYRGNPLKDEIEKKCSLLPPSEEIRKILGIDERPVISMLAGSRRHEVELILPKMLKAIRHFPGHQFILAGVKNLPDELYGKIIGDHPVSLVREKTYEVLRISEVALVKSGTATLEAALMKTPQVVCYKGDFFSMLIGWFVIRVKYISLVNLIMNREVVKELVQYDLTEKALHSELKAIMTGGGKREKMLSEYDELDNLLGPSGTSRRVAEDMIRSLNGDQ